MLHDNVETKTEIELNKVNVLHRKCSCFTEYKRPQTCKVVSIEVTVSIPAVVVSPGLVLAGGPHTTGSPHQLTGLPGWKAQSSELRKLQQ